MDKRIILAILIFMFVIGMVFFVRVGYSNNETSDSYVNTISVPNNSNSVVSENNNVNKISLSELSSHNTANDCWVVFENKVYDITNFLPKHPGGIHTISPYCGSADGFEKAFLKEHRKSKVSLLMDVGVFIGDFEIVGNL